MEQKALQGIKVIEYTSFVSGPYSAKLLADMGAEVIKIEKPGVGDEARKRGPFPDDIPHPEKSGLFLYLNTNKLGITLDPRTANGKKIFLDLVKQADIVIQDRPPKEMEALGLTYDALAKENTKLIMTSITPFGQTGPKRDYKAYNLNSSHGSGAAQITPLLLSEFELGPVKGGGFFDDYCDGLSAASATLVALFAREMTGEGQHVDVSKQEASIAYDRVEIGLFKSDDYIANRGQNRGSVSFLPCKDGYVMVTLGDDHQWDAMIGVLGNPAWAKDEKFKDRFARQNNAQELTAAISQWSKDLPKDKVYHMIGAAGTPAGALRSPGDIIERDVQLKDRNFFVEIDHPEAGRLTYPSAPYRFSETPWSVARAAPLLGEHNMAVYCDRLGLSKATLVKMCEAKII